MATLRSVLGLCCRCRDYHYAPVANTPFGDYVVGKMPHLSTGALERRDLHATVVVEVDVQRRQRQIVVAMEILHQAFRKIARGVPGKLAKNRR
jgi:hypothetical protein